MKTPKEKALKLFEQFIEIGLNGYQAKQCAIIAIDEMIIQNGDAWLLMKLDNDYYREMNGYLFQVKQEIEKL